MSSESFAPSSNLIGAVISQSNRDIQTRLHGLVDKMTTSLKSELDAVLKNLLDISDEYDETSRIILTLPCVKRAISTGPYPTTIFPDALANLREYEDEGEGDELADKDEVLAESELKEPVCEKERIEIVITEIVEPVLEEEEVASVEESVAEDALEEESVEDEEDALEEDVVDVEDAVEEVTEDVEEEDEEVEIEEEDVVDEEDEEVEEVEEEVVEEEKAEVVEEDEEVVEEDEEVEEEAVEDSVADAEVAEEEDEEGGVFEVEINGETYYTENEISGDIYNTDDNGDPDEIVGKFVEGVPVWN